MPKKLQNRPQMYPCSDYPEAVAQRCSVKKMFITPQSEFRLLRQLIV